MDDEFFEASKKVDATAANKLRKNLEERLRKKKAAAKKEAAAPKPPKTTRQPQPATQEPLKLPKAPPAPPVKTSSSLAPVKPPKPTWDTADPSYLANVHIPDAPSEAEMGTYYNAVAKATFLFTFGVEAGTGARTLICLVRAEVSF